MAAKLMSNYNRIHIVRIHRNLEIAIIKNYLHELLLPLNNTNKIWIT